MSFDHLQERIRAVKSPVVARLDLRPENLPPALLARRLEAGAEPLACAAAAAEEFGRAVLEGLSGEVPAVSFPVPAFETLGWRGLAVLENLISCAKDRELFVIADARCSGLGPAASGSAAAWLGRTRVGDALCSVFDADCVTVSPYLGSDCLNPVLEVCTEADKCALVLAKTPNPSSVELEDLVAGDRVVYTVAADLARRVARDTAGKKYGFLALGAVIGTPYPAEMKRLRRRLDRVFFLVPGCDTPEDMDIARHAFDELGRGAAVCTGRAILDPCRESGDYAGAARAAAGELRRRWRDYVTLL